MAKRPIKMKYGIQKIMDDYGYEDVDLLLQDTAFDSICPGVCYNCGYTTEVEPDQAGGWCEKCETPTVISALRLLDMI